MVFSNHAPCIARVKALMESKYFTVLVHSLGPTSMQNFKKIGHLQVVSLSSSKENTELYFVQNTHQFRWPIYPINIYIFWLPEAQGVQICKRRRATPPGGGVSLGVGLEKFWDIQNVARGQNSLSSKFQPSRSNTTPGALRRRCKFNPITPFSVLGALEARRHISSSQVGNAGDLPQL